MSVSQTAPPSSPSPTSFADLVGKVELFAGLDRVALAKLSAFFDRTPVQDGETVFEQGDEADALYVVYEGTFHVFTRGAQDGGITGLLDLSQGDCFGEMGLVTGEIRSATVIARGPGEVLRLDRPRFDALMSKEPSVGRAVARMLTRRLRAANEALGERDQIFTAQLDAQLGGLSPELRVAVLQASILEPRVSGTALAALFGEATQEVVGALDRLGVHLDQPTPILRLIRERFEEEVGPRGVTRFALEAAPRLRDAACWGEALSVFARYGPRTEFVETLAEAVRDLPEGHFKQVAPWVERLTDEEAASDANLALAVAQGYEERGDLKAASTLLRRALGTAAASQDALASQRLSVEISRLAALAASHASAAMLVEPAQAGRHRAIHARMASTPKRVYAAGGALVIAAVVQHFLVTNPILSFVLLLAAASVLWLSDVVPSSAVSLGLVAAWLLLGLVPANQAVAGFGSMDWVFVLAVLGLGAAIARSGLLFRVGLVLVRRMPSGLFLQSSMLMLTGVLLGPLLPSSAGRAALTSPFAVAISDALRLPPRHPAAAVLGLSSWIGAGPLRYLFLNASTASLLAWGLMPDEQRLQFDWIRWFTGAFPLALFVAIGSLLTMYALFRPRLEHVAQRERVDTQLAVLGPPSHREWSMLAVLALTVIGWFLAPSLGVHVATVALLGLLAAVAVGNLDKRGLQEMDINLLILIGVALSTAKVAAALGVDRLASAYIGGFVNSVGTNPVTFVVGVGAVTALLRLVLGETQTILFLALALIPVAPTLGVNPWLVVLAIISCSHTWIVPTQDQAYLAAYAASEGRLYSPAQARTMGIAFVGVTLLGLAVTSLYWNAIGLM